ncbi:MAG: permease-like cell division protein FtsX [Gammaproteobacteria bacterium]|nr:permease-like cell division protein FtsX [Gammaproteobacteria bacterium]MDH4315757.1 permease-like cell division protein FtsX [Gammaproteobacteria bacterium]MDH5214995.1 permease-like cell division protein FtsX [Gammaproteobacteria bacterium]
MKRPSEALAPARRSGVISTWFSRHVSTSIAALGRVARQPFASLMTILVIAVTLALPAALHLVIKNAQAISGNWANALDFSVYLKQGISESDAKRLAGIIDQRADVDQVVFISADEALAEFRDQSGFGAALDQLKNNPLPHTLVVRPSAASTEKSMMLLNEELSNLPETDFVQADTDWVRRFHAILEILERSVVIGAALLGAAILVIIGNTIRLDIQNRREEIEVTKLIGASNAFVRRPFLYTGFWYGLGGGLLALGLVAYGLFALQPPVARLAGLYGSSFEILSLDIEEGLLIIGTGVFLGLTGSWIAAARHMRRIEPR